MCMCVVCLSCGKDDDGDDGNMCYECTITYENWNTPDIIPICGEKTYVEAMVKNYENEGKDNDSYSVRCVRKK
jgi:hypothetical protein